MPNETPRPLRSLSREGRPMRSVRIHREDWNQAKRRAHVKDRVTWTFACEALVRAYADGLLDLPVKERVHRAPEADGSFPHRAVRVSEDSWDRARERSVPEGFTVSAAVAALIDGYGRGQLSLPPIRFSEGGDVTAL